jgi:hypothetical protein
MIVQAIRLAFEPASRPDPNARTGFRYLYRVGQRDHIMIRMMSLFDATAPRVAGIFGHLAGWLFNLDPASRGHRCQDVKSLAFD